jgi:hypothetical protein
VVVQLIILTGRREKLVVNAIPSHASRQCNI